MLYKVCVEFDKNLTLRSAQKVLCPIIPLFPRDIKSPGSYVFLATHMVETRNWNLYNRMLEERGDIVVYISDAALRNADEITKMNEKKVGRPFRFGNLLILGAYGIKCLTRFGYRQIRGLIRGISNRLGYGIVPNFRTIWWRIDKLAKSNFIIKRVTRGGKIAVVIDSTGLKNVNDGEYRTNVYDKRKEWTKFHIVVEKSTGKFANVGITRKNIMDVNMLIPMVDPIKNDVNELDTDGGYDSNENFEYCEENNIEPQIPVHIPASKRLSGRARRKHVIEQLGLISARGVKDRDHRYTKEYRKLHQQEWRRRVHHGKRWIVETTISAYKRIFGEYFFSKKWNMKEKEVMMKALVYNKFLDFTI